MNLLRKFGDRIDSKSGHGETLLYPRWGDLHSTVLNGSAMAILSKEMAPKAVLKREGIGSEG